MTSRVLQRSPCNGLHLELPPWGARVRRSVRGQGKLCQLLSCFLRQHSPRTPILSCSQPVPLHPSSMSVLFLKRLRTSQNTATPHHHPRPPPSPGACWDAWPLAGVIQWIYSLICCDCSVHPARNGFSWVLDVHFGGIYLLAFTIAGQLAYTMCFLSSGLPLRKISPAFLPFISRLQIYTLFPQKALLSPVTFGHSFSSAPCLSLCLKVTFIIPRDCVVCSWLSLWDLAKKKAQMKE